MLVTRASSLRAAGTIPSEMFQNTLLQDLQLVSLTVAINIHSQSKLLRLACLMHLHAMPAHALATEMLPCLLLAEYVCRSGGVWGNSPGRSSVGSFCPTAWSGLAVEAELTLCIL